MRISILDPALRRLGGHFTDLDLRLAARLGSAGPHRKRSLQEECASVPGPADLLGANASLKRTFTTPSPDWIKPGFDDVERLRLESAAYHQDLLELETADLMVWPSAISACAMAHALYGLKTPTVFTIFESPGAISAASPGAFAAVPGYMRLRRQKVVWGLHVEDFMPIWSSILGPGNMQLLPYPTAGKPLSRKLSEPLASGWQEPFGRNAALIFCCRSSNGFSAKVSP